PRQPGRSRAVGESPTPNCSLTTSRRTRPPGARRSAPPGLAPTEGRLAKVLTRRPPRRSGAGWLPYLQRSSRCPPLTAKLAAPRGRLRLPASSAPHHIIILLAQVTLGSLLPWE